MYIHYGGLHAVNLYTLWSRCSLQTSVSLLPFVSWGSISTISSWYSISTIPPSGSLNSVYILAVVTELPLVALSCVDCTLLSSLKRVPAVERTQLLQLKINTCYFANTNIGSALCTPWFSHAKLVTPFKSIERNIVVLTFGSL